MLKPVKFALTALCAGAVTSAQISAVHAFDLEDYNTTFRATRDAYRKAWFEREVALPHLRFWAGVMALYGYGGQYTGVEGRNNLQRFGWQDDARPAMCRGTVGSMVDSNAPAFPERRAGRTDFAVGNRGIGGSPSARYQSASRDAYLHFRSEGFGDAVEAVTALVADYPFADPTRRAEAEAALAADVALLASGITPDMPVPDSASTNWGLAGLTFEERTSIYHAWQREGAAPPPNSEAWYNGDLRTALTAEPPPVRYGEYCFDDADLCPEGIQCVDSTLGGTASWEEQWLYGVHWLATAESSLRFRCAYLNQAPVFPPNRVDEMSRPFWPTLTGVSDVMDGPGLHGANGAHRLIEDISTTYRANRDAYLRAQLELNLATGPYKAAAAASAAANAAYLESLMDYFE
jgi:hypothetical protein